MHRNETVAPRWCGNISTHILYLLLFAPTHPHIYPHTHIHSHLYLYCLGFYPSFDCTFELSSQDIAISRMRSALTCEDDVEELSSQPSSPYTPYSPMVLSPANNSAMKFVRAPILAKLQSLDREEDLSLQVYLNTHTHTSTPFPYPSWHNIINTRSSYMITCTYRLYN